VSRASTLVLCLAALVLGSCAPEIKTVASPTQVTLRIYNNDLTLLASMRALSVTFSLREGDAWRAYPEKTFAVSELRWPVDIPIIPGKREDENKQFEVVVRALDGTTVLAETRAVTAFRRDKRLVLETWLYRCPGHDKPFVCEEPDCHGQDCTICKPDGTCGAVGFTDPKELEEFNSNDAPGKKPVPGWTTDVDSATGTDAGTDASMDASTPDMKDGGRDGAVNDAGDPCTEGALRCDSSAGATRSVCREGKWIAATPCTADELCDPSSSPPGQCKPSPCAGECATCAVEGLMRCVGEASPEREVCQKGVYVPAEACPADSLCDRAAATPGDCSPIVEGCKGQDPGTPVCVGATRIVCGPDLVSTTGTPKNCKSPAYCEQGAGASCATCITDEHACEGNQLQVCNDARDGFVNKGDPCPQDAPCNKSLKQCTKLTCEPGKWSCAGDTLRHCNADGTGYIASDEEACGAGLCNADGQRCNVCKPDLIRCPVEGEKGRVQCASDGRRENAIASCPNACLAGSCVACRPSDTRCDPSTPQTTLRYRQECNGAGAWNAGTDCFARGETGETCLYSAATGTSACGGQCAAGTPRCNTQTKNPEVCGGNGEWQQADVCTANEICRVANSSATCEENRPYPLGNSSFAPSDNWVTYSLDIDWAYFVPFITPGRKVRLQALQVRAPGMVNGVGNAGSCELAVYTDNNGKPGTVKSTSRDLISLPTSGGMSVAGSTPHLRVLLEANTTYWVGGSCYLFGAKPAIYIREAPSSYRFTKDPSDPFPSNPAGSVARANTYPFYVEVLDEP